VQGQVCWFWQFTFYILSKKIITRIIDSLLLFDIMYLFAIRSMDGLPRFLLAEN